MTQYRHPVLCAFILICTVSQAHAWSLKSDAPGVLEQPNFIELKGLIRNAGSSKDVLVKDVMSLFDGSQWTGINEASCARYCLRTPGCNAFAFCKDGDGCGTGCSAFQANNPKLQAMSGPKYITPEPAWKDMKTFQRMGPFGATTDCQPGNPEKWPINMCTLMKLPATKVSKAPTVDNQDSNAGKGWVSGYINQAGLAPFAACGGLPITTCVSCLNTKAPDSSNAVLVGGAPAPTTPAKCIQCAKAVVEAMPLLEQVLSYTSRADGCAKAGSEREQECLVKDQPCAKCLTKDSTHFLYDPLDCVKCVDQNGAGFVDACHNCANLTPWGDPSPKAQCMTCLETLKPVACEPDGPKGNCWDPVTQSSSCGNCAEGKDNRGDLGPINPSQAEYESCVACMKDSPGTSSMCNLCTTGLPWQANTSNSRPAYLKAQCYDCARNVAPGSDWDSCSSCFSPTVKDFAQRQQCLSCALDPAVKRAGTCSMCGEEAGCNTFADRQQCMQCLTEDHVNWYEACRCLKAGETRDYDSFAMGLVDAPNPELQAVSNSGGTAPSGVVGRRR